MATDLSNVGSPSAIQAGRLAAYFSHLASYLEPDKSVHTLAVAHLVPNTLSFAPALNSMTTLSSILAKPKTLARPEHQVLSQEYRIHPLSRVWASTAREVVAYMASIGLTDQKVIFLDIGGYFAASIDAIADEYPGEILGLVEGTENGVVKYEERAKRFGPHRTPIVTTARSPLKLPEDFLVGSSVVFSIEAVLRQHAEILQTRRAAVIGYGRVGSSIAEILRGRGINTVVFDTSPVQRALAAARGFHTCSRLAQALSIANLVVCATGNRALDLQGFGQLRTGSVVASVTSADDEFDLDSLAPGYDKVSDGQVSVYRETKPSGRYFTLIADGNAANFLHGAVIGPAIQLIEGEKLAAVRLLMDRLIPATGQIAEVPFRHRNAVAEIWNNHFL